MTFGYQFYFADLTCFKMAKDAILDIINPVNLLFGYQKRIDMATGITKREQLSANAISALKTMDADEPLPDGNTLAELT